MKNYDSGSYKALDKADCEAYLHRIGRTGRFGDYGIAVNIIDKRSDRLIKEI